MTGGMDDGESKLDIRTARFPEAPCNARERSGDFGGPAAAESARTRPIVDTGGPVGLWEYALGAGAVQLDAVAAGLLGQPPSALPVRALWARVHPHDRPRLHARIAGSLREGRAFDCEYLLTPRHGAPRMVRTVAEPVCDGEGRVRKLTGAVQDVTPAHYLVRELRAAQTMAQAANRAKSRFLAVVSHELRTPLNAIKGFSEVMQLEALGPLGAPAYRAYAGHITDSAQHLLSLIDAILDVTQLDSGDVSVRAQPVAIAELAAGVAGLLRMEAASNGVSLETPDCLAAEVTVDPRLMRQALFHLVHNAVKFAPQDSSVRILGRRRPDGGYALSVIDQGPGVPEAVRAAIAQPFVQSDDSLTRRHGGLGIGLYLARAIVDAHGGSLAIRPASRRHAGAPGAHVEIGLPAHRVVTPAA